MVYQETFVQRDQHRIYARDHPGAEPAIILMHGLPDNLHLYDRLLPYLSPPRRVVAFDFLGWGSSDKPSGYPYTALHCYTAKGFNDSMIQRFKCSTAPLAKVSRATGGLLGPANTCCHLCFTASLLF